MKKQILILLLVAFSIVGKSQERIVSIDSADLMPLYEMADSVIIINDTIPAYIMYINTKEYNIYSAPQFVNLKFKNENTRKDYDERVFWCPGYAVYNYNRGEMLYLDEKKRNFSKDIKVLDYFKR